MSNLELLETRDAMGWADATRCPAGRLRDRIITVRQAQLEKRSVPEPSAEYRAAAQLAYRVPTVRKVNAHSRAPLSMRELLAKAARQAEEIHGARCRAEVAAACLSNRVDEAYEAVRAGRNPFEERAAKQLMRCSSLTSDRDDHEYGVQSHANIARKLCDRREDNWAARADTHFAASEAHRAAAADPTPDNCGKAVVACQRCAATSEKDDE